MQTVNPEALASTTSTFRSRTRLGLTGIGFVASAWNALAAFRRRRRLEAELYDLDDRMLRDIGLTRTEIPFLARHGSNNRNDFSGL